VFQAPSATAFSQLIVHGIPNRSTRARKRAAQPERSFALTVEGKRDVRIQLHRSTSGVSERPAFLSIGDHRCHSNRVVDMQVLSCIFCLRAVPMTDTDDVFKALADRSRRLLLDRLNANNGQTLTELAAHLEMTRQAVTQHLNVLEAANLVVTTWRGREKLHFLNPVPLQEIYDRWICKFERSRLRALRDLKQRLEGTRSA
jgi:DNA-binding transcriptional ArsR family regulator